MGVAYSEGAEPVDTLVLDASLEVWLMSRIQWVVAVVPEGCGLACGRGACNGTVDYSPWYHSGGQNSEQEGKIADDYLSFPLSAETRGHCRRLC